MTGSTDAATPLRHIPNVLTVVRVALVAPAGWLLWHDALAPALALIAAAGLSDALDGILARRYGWRTRFGAIADPAADKLLAVTVFTVLTVQGHLPWWLFAIVIGRDIVIVGGALAYRQVTGSLEIAPTLLSKLNTGFQIALLLAALLGMADWSGAAAVRAALDPLGFALVATLGAASGLHYVAVWTHRAFCDPSAPHRLETPP